MGRGRAAGDEVAEGLDPGRAVVPAGADAALGGGECWWWRDGDMDLIIDLGEVPQGLRGVRARGPLCGERFLGAGTEGLRQRRQHAVVRMEKGDL